MLWETNLRGPPTHHSNNSSPSHFKSSASLHPHAPRVPHGSIHSNNNAPSVSFTIPHAALAGWLLRLWPIYYAWLMINPDIALLTRFNLTVPLLTGLVGLLIARANRRDAVETREIEHTERPMTLAA